MWKNRCVLDINRKIFVNISSTRSQSRSVHARRFHIKCFILFEKAFEREYYWNLLKYFQKSILIHVQTVRTVYARYFSRIVCEFPPGTLSPRRSVHAKFFFLNIIFQSTRDRVEKIDRYMLKAFLKTIGFPFWTRWKCRWVLCSVFRRKYFNFSRILLR